MRTLLEQSKHIWDEVQRRIVASIESNGSLEGINEFVPRRRLRSGQQGNPTLYVLSREVTVVEWGANRGIGELSVSFGLTHATVRPDDVSAQFEALIFTLTNMLMELPTIGGADDVRVVTVNPDDAPFGPENTLPWATATLIWSFQFIQPEVAV